MGKVLGWWVGNPSEGAGESGLELAGAGWRGLNWGILLLQRLCWGSGLGSGLSWPSYSGRFSL